MKFNKKFIFLFVFLVMFFFPSFVGAQEETLEGEVFAVLEEENRVSEDGGLSQTYQKLRVVVTRGSLKDQNIVVESGNYNIVNQPRYRVGDKLLLTSSKDFDGNDVFFITERIRRVPLFILFSIFLILSFLIGKKRGLMSILGMIISFGVIFIYVLPGIISGNNPIVVAIVGSTLIIPLTFYLSHGINKKTSAAIIGTVISLIITGLLALYFVQVSGLTGFASEEAGFLKSGVLGNVDIKGLLLAGIIIGILGVLDDVTVSQSAIVYQLKSANPKLKIEELYYRAMDVGQDHISSMINTLVLVYTGASLPLLLLFMDSSRSFLEIINYEIVADEIVRTLVGSIGLILAVPITTFVAVLMENQKTTSRSNK